jgi:hypothetical protein
MDRMIMLIETSRKFMPAWKSSSSSWHFFPLDLDYLAVFLLTTQFHHRSSGTQTHPKDTFASKQRTITLAII